jgi:hypothetical protein
MVLRVISKITLSVFVVTTLAACGDNGQASSITAPGSLKFDFSMANAGLIKACVSSASPSGAYTFTSTELTAHRDGDIVNSPAVVNHLSGSVECATVFNRPSAPSPIDPQAVVQIQQSGPGVFLNASCVADSPDLTSVCSDPVQAAANINHGTVVYYHYDAAIAPQSITQCSLSSGWYTNRGALSVTAKGIFFGTGATWTTVLSTNPKGNAYYILSRQYIAARLNVDAVGNAPPAAVQSALAGAEGFFTGRPLGNTTGVSKATLTAWSTTLESFNTGGFAANGWPHCDE